MLLRQKTLLVISLTVAGLVILLLAISTTVIRQGFLRAEEQEVQGQIKRVQAAFNYELKKFDELVNEWASWDNTYAFAAERASRIIRAPHFVEGDYTGSYLSAYLTAATFQELQINLVLLLDLEGKVIFGKAYNLEQQTESTLPASLLDLIKQQGLFVYKPHHQGKIKGILPLSEGLLMVACRPILTQSGELARGTLLMGRFLRPAVYRQMSEIIHVDFMIKPLAEFLSNFPIEDANLGAFTLRRTKQTLFAYFLMPAISSSQPLAVEVKHQRQIYKLGKLTLGVFLGLTLGAGLIFAAAILWLIESLMLKRLSRLDKEVRHIEQTRNLKQPISDNGQDELGALAKAIAGMLGALADSREQEEQAQARLRNLLEENRELIQQVLNVQEKERKNLVRELHDEVGQCLTAIQADSRAIQESLPPKHRSRASAEAILSVSAHIYDVMHAILCRLRPPALDALGLTDALHDSITEWQARHPKIRCQFQADQVTVAEDLAINIFRVVQESLTNIAKHAQATQVNISLKRDEAQNRLYLTIEDNGRGIALDQSWGQGLGLIGLRERAEAFGGTFKLDSVTGQGVRIFFSVPLFPKFTDNAQ